MNNTLNSSAADDNQMKDDNNDWSIPSIIDEDEGDTKAGTDKANIASLSVKSPKTINLILHGRKIVKIEKYQYGRLTLLWCIQYQNWAGLLLSLIWRYWSGTWAQASGLYIATHILSEIVLWYYLGHRCLHTFGAKTIHPLDFWAQAEHNKIVSEGGESSWSTMKNDDQSMASNKILTKCQNATRIFCQFFQMVFARLLQFFSPDCYKYFPLDCWNHFW